MKIKSGTVIQINLEVQAKISLSNGIIMLGIIKPSSHYEILEKETLINDIYFILADSSD